DGREVDVEPGRDVGARRHQERVAVGEVVGQLVTWQEPHGASLGGAPATGAGSAGGVAALPGRAEHLHRGCTDLPRGRTYDGRVRGDTAETETGEGPRGCAGPLDLGRGPAPIRARP